MPLPIIAAAIVIGAAGSGGAVAGGVGGLKFRRAKRTAEEKREELATAEAATAERRAATEREFIGLGETKLRALEDGLVPFHGVFSRLKNVDLHVDVAAEGAPEVDEVRVAEAGRLTLTAVDTLGGLATAGTAGAIAGGGAWVGVTSLAAASTGTAISGLSGAAASNAALAWLGGGSLATGGGGVALGTTMLTGFAAAPVLLVGGVLLHSKGREALTKAETFSANVDAAKAKHHEAQTVLHAAETIAVDIRRLVDQLLSLLTRETGWLDALTAVERDWTLLAPDNRERIRRLAIVAVATSDLVHTPIVDDNGALTAAIRQVFDRGRVVAGSIAR